MDVSDLHAGIHDTMEIHDLAGIGFTHAHVVDLPDQIGFVRKVLEGLSHGRETLRRSLMPRLVKGLHRLDVRLDLDARMSSEQLVTGAMWFDELTILRTEVAGK